MSRARLSREAKRQLGQFLTPRSVASAIVGGLGVSPDARVLEPSFGTGAFVFALIDALAPVVGQENIGTWARTNVHGCEIDTLAFQSFAAEWTRRGLGPIPPNFEECDFFRWLPPDLDRLAALHRGRYFRSQLESYDLIVGNPPFGGSIDPSIQDALDDIFGLRNGRKIKKETYAFFLVKCVDLLRTGGRLCFVCSDTILTIPTMLGLRHWIQGQCEVEISEVPGTFEETNQDLVLISLIKTGQRASHVTVFGARTDLADIEVTENLSWRTSSEFARYFSGLTVGDRMVASSGMTVGNNALFLRKISDGTIEEPYEFALAEEPVSLETELARARLGYLSEAQKDRILVRQRRGETRTIVRWQRRHPPVRIELPDDDYRYYNKASSRIVYSEAEWCIFWRDNGHYVYTFKKAGKWYLHGVGGKPFFGREGLTWALIAQRLRTRWLPPGYILDSGSPCAFLRSGVPHDELFFVMGWTLTDLCTRILKGVINHTRNIQSKDFERLPYPVWVSDAARSDAVHYVQELVVAGQSGARMDFDDPRVRRLNEFYAYSERTHVAVRAARKSLRPAALDARLF